MQFRIKILTISISLAFSAQVFAAATCASTVVVSTDSNFTSFGECITVNSGVTVPNGGAGAVIPILTNYGTINVLHDHQNITELYNYGVITNFTHFPGFTDLIENAQQGLALSGFNSLGSLSLPSTYRTYFTNSSTYGTVAFSAMSGYTLNTYGVRMAPGQNWASGTYTNVITSDSALNVSSYEAVSGITYNLVTSDGGLHWDLVVTAASPSRVFDAAQALQNTPASGAARVIDATPTISALFANQTTTQQLSNAASQSLPLLTGGMAQAINNALHGANRVIQSRQEGQQGRSSGDEFLGDKHAWFKPFGSWANQSDSNGVSGYDAKTYGMVFGADAEISDNTLLGVAFAYARSNVDSNSTVAHQSAKVDSYQVIAYGSYNISETTDVNLQVDIGQHENEGLRNINFMGSTAKSDYTSWSGHVGAGLAHSYALSEKTTLTPSVRADYTKVRDGSYSETNAGALNLNVQSNTAEELILGIDGKLAHTLNDKATFTANIGLGYDVINDQASITAAFAGAPSASFVTNGIDPSPWLLRGGLGVVGKASETVKISARYDIEARKDFDNQTASLKVSWAF